MLVWHPHGTTLASARALLAQHGFSKSAIRMGFTHDAHRSHTIAPAGWL
ncbi:MAG: hypothetical protein U0694_04560 [Anaerolineae bacterium]